MNDTPGIATRIDYEDFMKRGKMKEQEAKQRAKEATNRKIKKFTSLIFSIIYAYKALIFKGISVF